MPVAEEKQGATDRAIAKWMKTTQRARDDVIIATKVCGYNERFTWLRGEPTRVSRDQVHTLSPYVHRWRRTPGRTAPASSPQANRYPDRHACRLFIG